MSNLNITQAIKLAKQGQIFKNKINFGNKVYECYLHHNKINAGIECYYYFAIKIEKETEYTSFTVKLTKAPYKNWQKFNINEGSYE